MTYIRDKLIHFMMYRSSSCDHFISSELQGLSGLKLKSPILRFINTTGGRSISKCGDKLLSAFSVDCGNICDTTFYRNIYSIAHLSADTIKKKKGSFINVQYIQGIMNLMSHSQLLWSQVWWSVLMREVNPLLVHLSQKPIIAIDSVSPCQIL